MFGRYWNRICQDELVAGEELQETIVDLSTRYSGFYAQVHLGVICRQIMVVGRTLIDDFVDGETKGFGRNYWNR